VKNLIEQIFPLIGQYAFPIVVTVYLLWERKHRDDKILEEVKMVITTNTEALAGIKEVMLRCSR